MHHTGSLIIAIVGSIVAAAVLGLLANRLRISPLVGYLIAGIIFGQLPDAYQADNELISQLAEIGVILLMFGVGLHFSLNDLLSVKNIAIPGAIVQITVATLLGMGLSALLGWSLLTGLIFGLCLSTASTVVLLRALEERQLIESHRGKIAIGWLVVEDLVMVLVLVLLPALVYSLNHSDAGFTALAAEMAKTIGLVVAFIIMMIIFGRRFIPWLLTRSASTGSNELFTLTVLAIALGIAFIAVQLFGASFALGAFFAGMVLNGSEFSHRAAKDTLPLRDAFAVLFFVSVGMLFKPDIIFTNPLSLLGVVLIIIICKSFAAYVLVRLFGHSKRTALTVSASLAQIGEFAYILAALGVLLSEQLNMPIFPAEAQSLILAGSIISIVLNPLIFTLVERYLDKTENIVDYLLDEVTLATHDVMPKEIANHAILIGYSKSNSIISHQLRVKNIPSVIIDHSLMKVEELIMADYLAILGDAGDQATLETARIDTAKWVIVALPNGYKAAEVVSLVKKLRPDIEIYVRTYHDEEDAADYIAERGATQIITGETEIANRILSLLNIDTVIGDNNDIESQAELPIVISEESNLPEGNGSPI